MVIDNCNYKILYDKRLEYDDYVHFDYKQEKYYYQVESSFLNNLKRSNNGAIFDALDLNKYDIATKIYGYESNKGDWPCYKNEDYEALNKLVIFLFEEIERREKPENSIKKEPEHKINTKLKIKIKVDSNIKITLK